MKIINVVFAALAFISAGPALAQSTQSDQDRAIDLIIKMADELCVEAQTSGSATQANIKVELDAKLLALLKKLGEVEGSLAADYSRESFVGVLRGEVLESIKAANTCRMHVLDTLNDKLLPAGSAHPEPVIQNKHGSKLSPQDAYLVATHPTKVVLKELKFMRFLDDGGQNFLTAVLENESEIPAQGLVIDWVGEKKGVPLANAKVVAVKQSNYARALGSTGISISAKTSSYFPIVSVAELQKLILGENPDYCLYDASPDPIDPQVSNKAILEKMDSSGGALGGYSSTSQVGVRLRIKYTTIFEQTVTRYPMVFVHLVEKGSTGLLWYPGSGKVGPARCIGA